MTKWPFVGIFEKAAIALVADERLVALLQLLLQRGQDGGSVGGALLHLIVVAADHVAPPGQRDRLGFVVDLVSAPGQENGTKGADR